MLRILSILFLTTGAFFSSCSNANTDTSKTNLTPAEFDQKVKTDSSAILLDVRTPEEFADGHIMGAKNVNWHAADFENQVNAFGTGKTIYAYCQSGRRSAEAAELLRSKGYTVYELTGGIMKWRSEGLPESRDNTSEENKGLSMEEFRNLLHSEKMVLVDFYAPWCAPCKKMEPFMNEIAKEKADSVVLVRINTDENVELCQALKIESIPVLQLYKGSQLQWTHEGYLDKTALLQKLR